MLACIRQGPDCESPDRPIRTVERKQLFKQPKTAKSRRQIDLPAMLVEELRALREEQAKFRKEFGSLYEDYDLVLCQPNGKPLHAHNVTRRDFRHVLGLRGLRAESRTHGVFEELLPKPLPKIRFMTCGIAALPCYFSRGASEDRAGAPGAFHYRYDDGHLQSRAAGDAARAALALEERLLG